MPITRAVQSRQNSRVKALRAAFDHPGREGLIGIEGEHLILEAVRSRLQFEAMFVITGNEDWLDQISLPGSVEILSLPADVFSSAVTTDSPQPIAALVRAPAFAIEGIVAAANPATPNPLILISAGLQDPGNLGTLIRSAEAFGATGIIMLPGSVSPWNAKAIRASSGSVFRLPVCPGNIESLSPVFRQHRIQLLAAVASHSAGMADLRGPSAILIGNEGAGLSPELLALSDARIAIPCPGVTESLNAAIAGSVLLYEASRQRAQAQSQRKAP